MNITKGVNFDRAIAVSIMVFICLVFLCVSASFYIVFNYFSDQRDQEAPFERVV